MTRPRRITSIEMGTFASFLTLLTLPFLALGAVAQNGEGAAPTTMPDEPGFLVAEKVVTVPLDAEHPSRKFLAAGKRAEAVCMKAVEFDPARRYATALEFADDLARAAAHRPTQALPCGPVRRVALLVRRHPPAAAAVLVAILAGGGFGWQAWREKEAVVEDTRASRAKLDARVTAVERVFTALREGREPAPEDETLVRSEFGDATYAVIRRNPEAASELARRVREWVAATRNGSSRWAYPAEEQRVGDRITFRMANLRSDRDLEAPVSIRMGTLSEDFLDIHWKHEFEAEPVIEDGIATVVLPEEIRPAPQSGETVYLWRFTVRLHNGSRWESGDDYMRCVAPGFLDAQVARRAPALAAFDGPLRTILKAAVLLDLAAPAAALETLDAVDASTLTPALRSLARWTRLQALEKVDPLAARALIEEEEIDER